MKETIKQYFEEAIQTDEALKNVYDEKKLDKCIQFVNDQARKELGGKSGAIIDSVIFKWCRDFMYGDIPAEKEEPVKEEKTVVEDDVPEESNIDDRKCENCGYQSDSICIKSGAALGDLLSTACKEYIRKATEEDVAGFTKDKLVIESVQEMSEEKPKKTKNNDYQPSLFDFDDFN